MNRRFVPIGLLYASFIVISGCSFASAQSSETSFTDPAIASEVQSLNDDVATRKLHVDQLQRSIDDYAAKIKKQEAASSSLKNELELLSNRIQKTNLDIETTSEQTKITDAEIAVLDAQIRDLQARLDRQKILIEALIQRINAYDNDWSLQILFSSDSFAELFDRLQALKHLEADLDTAILRAKADKAEVSARRSVQDTKRKTLVALEEDLRRARLRLDEESASKQGLLISTKNSESRFRSLLTDMRQEQISTNNEIAALQTKIENRLKARGGTDGEATISWPVTPSYKGLSTVFHDSTYPFRHLFQHTGIDIPQPQGTPIAAAAPGYVAWVRQGALYGNYIMIVHTDGLATLYAHLSRTIVKQDQYVGRGEIIGRSGGALGSSGAGLSTGPHLHFEVRLDGIPVNPLEYLPSRP